MLDDLNRLFEGDRSVVASGQILGFGFDFATDPADLAKEYDFKINLMEHELQAVQTENSSLVQTVLRLKQEVRDKKSETDQVAKTLVVQESAQLKRQIHETDDKLNRIQAELTQLRERIAKTNLSIKQKPGESYEELKSVVAHLETSNKVLEADYKHLKQKNYNN